ncbi:histidine phosphatase family protein [Alphaproteobacteria bacterium]|nr:histidine phosphatase family protein [Alphaproteobacteria bacterium]
MIKIIFIRHAETEWNSKKLLQGRKDIPLSIEGKKNAKNWKLDVENFTLWSSPLRRATETAQIIFSRKPILDDLLIEMDWGYWEGKSLSELRNALGNEMKNIENKGLDMNPTNGESPRKVQKRLLEWFEKLDDGTHIAITHKGVIRSSIALATGWNMKDKEPERVNWGKGYIFYLNSNSQIKYDKTISLE